LGTLTVLELLLVATTRFAATSSSPAKSGQVRTAQNAQRGTGLPTGNTAPGATQAHFVEAYGKLPLSFEANQGQTDARVNFLSRGPGYTLFLTSDETVLVLRKPSAVSNQLSVSGNSELEPRNWKSETRYVSSVLRLKLIGTNPAAHASGLDELPGKSNYFLGNDPKKWRTNVPNYAKVKYENVYPGIDLVYYGKESGGRNQESEVRSQESVGSSTRRESGSQLEYDFVVSPGADPRAIRLAIDGAQKMEIDASGDLVLRSEAGPVRLHKPQVYQPTNSRDTGPNSQFTIHNSELLDGRYILLADNRIGFEVPNYDKSRPLIIDPVLSYSTYLGGSDSDHGFGIAVDVASNAYIVGITSSSDFPTKNAYQGYLRGAPDVFVAKIDPSQSGSASLIYSTYLGGGGGDWGTSIAVDPVGNAYITGRTNSGDFPTTLGTFQGSPHGYWQNAFVTKLGTSGSNLVYSTYLGGGSSQEGRGIAVDTFGNAYVTGATDSGDFPTTAGAYQSTQAGAAEAFLTKFNSTGTGLLYSTFLGGTGSENYDYWTWYEPSAALAVDSAGMAYVTGFTSSADFPTTAGVFQPSLGGGFDIFVAKLNPAASGASSLVYSTYLGGMDNEYGWGIAVDAAGSAWVAGNAGATGFVAKLDPNASTITCSASPAPGGAIYAVALDSGGNAYAAGTVIPGGAPAPDAFVAKLNSSCEKIYTKTFGGSSEDKALGVAADAAGNVYVAGWTVSSDFPTTAGAYDTSCGTDGQCNGGYWDAFVVKITPGPEVTLSPPSLDFGQQIVGTTSAPLTVTVTNTGDLPLTVTGIAASGDFAVLTEDCTANPVPVGATCTISMTFSPSSTGIRTGTLTITDNAVDSPQAVDLTGTGVAPPPTLSLAPGSLSFGNQSVCTTSNPQSVTLTNTGTTTLTITSIIATGEFNQTNTCGGTLAPGTGCTISVTFTPAVSGSRTGAITVTSDATGSPHAVALTGIGVGSGWCWYDDFESYTVGSFPSPNWTFSGNSDIAVDNSRHVSGNQSVRMNGVGGWAAVLHRPLNIPPPLTVEFHVLNGGDRAVLALFTAPTWDSGGRWVISFDSDGKIRDSYGGSVVGMYSPGQWVKAKVTYEVLDAATVRFRYWIDDVLKGSVAVPSLSNEYQLAYLSPIAGTGTVWFDDIRVTPGVTGSAPAATLSTTNLTFGDQTVGMTSEAQTVTLSNRGNAPLTIGYISVGGDFGQTNNCGASLPAGATCTINVTFTPADTGTRTGAVTITDDALGSPRKIDLSGTGVPPHVSVTPPSLDFGNQLVGTPSAPQTVTLTNNGTETLNISNIATSGDFAQTNTCGTSVAAGNSCTFDVRFSPTEAGPRTGTLAITDDAEGSPHTVSLSGTGAQPAVSLEPPNLNFSNVRVGTTSGPQAVALTNTGAAPLSISSITTSAGFGQTSDCPIAPSTLAAGGSCTINVRFTPTQAVQYEGQLTVTDNASGSPHTVNLYGTGVGPVVSLLPTRLVFANQNVKTTSPPQSVTLTNSGAWPLEIYNIAVTVGFAQSNDCPIAPSTLDVGAYCTINVRFAPTEAVYYSGKLTVTDNAPGRTHQVELIGTGMGPVVSLRPPNQSFGEQVLWTNSAPKVLTLTSTGTSTLTISGFMMIGASYADFGQSNNCVGQVPIGVSCSVHVVFTPRLEGSRTAYLVVIDDAADSPQIAAFTGTGRPNPNTPPPQAYTLVRADYATGAYPVALTRGDFNGDGLLDVVVADGAGAAVSLLLGAANGTLQSHVEYATGTPPVAVASGDFNGDGKLDVAVASKQNNNVVVLLGKGDGTFQAPVAYATGLSPSGVVAGDFNSDNKFDLAVTNSADSTVSILLGNGDGTFQGQTTLATGTNPTSVTAADLNADNKLDLVVTNAGNNTVSVLLGNGNGTFQTPGVFATGAYPVSAAVGDFNRDGSPDLAVANLNGDTVSILLGNGNGTFGTQTTYATGDYPAAVIAEDFNGDNKLDLAVADSNCDAAGTCSATGFVSVLLGNGNGTFQPHVQYASGSGPQALLAADFNRDGRLDLAVANARENTVSVFIGQGDGTFGTRNDQSTGGTSPSSVVTADFNGDSNTDVAVANQGSNTVTVSLGNEDGTFQSPQSFATGRSPAIIAVADFNGDSKLDLAVTNSLDNTVSILLGNGDGTFQPQTAVPAGTGPQGILAVDFNGDSKVDLTVANFVDNTVWVLLGNGNGTFQAPVTLATGANPISLAAADFNLDGKLDLAVANQGANTVSVLLGIGDGTFTSGVQYPTGATPSLVAAADFNMDGKPDLAVVNAGDNTLSILKGKGDGTFGARANYATGNNPASVTVGDFNGDGIPDVAVANKGGSGGAGGLSAKASRGGAGGKLDVPLQAPITGTISVLLGTSSGVMQSRLDYTTGPNPTAAATGTFTKDGSSGLAVANADGTVSILVNTPVAALSRNAIEFGNQVVGTTSAPVAVTLSDPGSAPLALLDNVISGPFTKSDTCIAPTKLPVGGQCTINVRFAPTAQGSATGSLTLFSILRTSPQIVALSGTGMPPGPLVLLSPSSLIFSDQVVGQSSEPQTVTLTNNGTETLNISNIAISGDFARTNTCGTSVAAGNSCTFDVRFSPTEAGPRTGTLAITDDAEGSPHTVDLSGTGVQAGVSLSPSSLSFGDQLVGTPSTAQSVTLTNSGTTTLTISNISITGDFSQSNTCGSSLAAGANCAINVTFTPTATGGRSGAVTVTHDAPGSPHSVPLTGTGVGPVVVLPPIPPFPAQPVCTTSAPQSITLCNMGDVPLTIAGISVTGDFAQTNGCPSSLAPGTCCTLNITFHATAPGTRTGTLTISSNAPSSPHTATLTGTGIAPAVTLTPPSLSFSDQRVGTPSAPQTVALTNSGNATLAITSIVASGDYAQTNDCGSAVAAGLSCTISVTFTPTATGPRNGEVTVTSNAPGTPHRVPLTGTGTAPELCVAPISPFAPQLVGTVSPAQPVTLTNCGTAPLTISSISVTGDFSQTNNCPVLPATLAPSASCAVNVTFAPTTTGSRTGTLTITSDAPGIPRTVPLSGTGTDFTVSVDPPSRTIRAGESTTYTLTVTPVSGFNQAVALTCTATPALSRGTCTISPNPVTPDGTGDPIKTATVTVTTTAPSMVGPNSGPRLAPPGAPARWLWLLALGTLAALAAARKRRVLLGLGAALLLVVLWATCGGGGGGGGGGGNPGTPKDTYRLTLTGTCSGVPRSTTADLTVK
jgi:hypothetical protein